MKYKLLTTSLLIGASLQIYALDFNATAKALASESLTMKTSRLENRASIEELKGENSLPPLDAEFGYLWGTGETINKWNVSVSQSMDWPGSYVARRKGIAATERALAAAERASLVAKTLEIKLAMIDLVAAKRNFEISSMLNDTISQMIELVRKGAEEGEITKLDLNKLEIERIAVSKQLSEDKRSIATALSSLESLCGRNIDDIAVQLTEFPDEPLLSVEGYELLLTDANPTIFEAKQNILSAKSMAQAEKQSLYPGLSLGYTYENEVVDKWHGVTVGVSIPLFSSRGNAKAAKLRAESAEVEATLTAIQETATMRAERNQALILFKQIEQYRAVFAMDENMKLLKKAYRAGQLTTHEYIGDLNYFVLAKREYIDAQYQYALIMARLNRLKAFE